MRRKYRNAITVFLLIFVATATFSVIFFIQSDLRIGDSGALYGGNLEKGYLSAGYLITTEKSGEVKTCGHSVINPSISVTAGHCVDNAEKIMLGKGDFSRVESRNIKVIRAIQKEGWVKNKERSNDFSILVLDNNPTFFDTFSAVSEVQEGCNYRVVAYGRTENPSENVSLPRKSAFVCARDLTASTFVIHGQDSGICFGDSGSPVYLNNSEQLVGIVASIILDDSNTSANPCAIGNKAIVVRADANINIINDTITQLGNNNFVNVSTSNSLILETRKATLLERLGLNNVKWPDISIESDYQNWTINEYLIVGSVGGAVFTFLLMTFVFIKWFVSWITRGNSQEENIF